MLLAEVVRHELPLSPFRQWLFVDTLAILEAAKEEVGPCRKLQCLVRHYAYPTDLRAHRAACLALNAFIDGPFGPFTHLTIFDLLSALDDCIALRHVMEFLAARLGIGLVELHRRFAVCFDEPSSIAQVRTLLDDSKPV